MVTVNPRPWEPWPENFRPQIPNFPYKNTAASPDCSDEANSVFSLTLTLDTNGLNGTRLHL